MALRCPKCGRDTGDDAVICPGCDFILDSSFLGDDIMDVEADRRPKAKDGSPPARALSSTSASQSSASSVSPAPQNRKGKKKRLPPPRATEKVLAAPGAHDESWAADALILGDLDDDEVASFQASDTGLAQREVTMARMYVGGSIQALLMPDAIPEIDPELDLASARVTPFERHVLDLVNGRRPVARIKAKARLKEDEFQTALALLADKGFLRLKGRAKRKKKPAPQPFPAERTLIAETPSAQELDDERKNEGEAKGFDLDEVRTGPGPKDSSDIHHEHTLIQPAPRFDDDELGDVDGSARKAAGAEAPASDVSEIDEGPLSFADSLISEENVFASAEEVVAKESQSASRAQAPKPRAHRRPPLPGELPPGQWPAAEVDEPPAAGSRFGEAADDDLADVDAASDTRRASPASSFRSSPPPLPPDASRETPAAPGIEDEAVAFEDLATGLPTPMSVNAADISLLEVAAPPQQAQPGTAPSSPARAGGIVEPPNTDPKAIEVSDFSEPVVKPRSPVIPRLPGAGAPPAIPGGRSVPPPRPAMPRMMPAVVVPPAAAVAARASDKSEEQPAHDSDSGESPVGAAVSFEMLRKSERIFEQAEKDIAAGNASSAIMNVKLALIYNPGEKRYRQFLVEWERMQAGEPPKPSKESILLEEAQEAEQKGDYAKALELLQKALERAPKNAGLHNRVGVLMATRLKRYKEAAEHVMTAIDLAPGNLAYKNNLGKILAKEESAIHKMPMKKQKQAAGEENRVLVKKLRPKMF